ncbi:TetR/AcrR family transcriptional regulator [Methylobacterium isbiliense]|jgi:TetR/AcrR family transcriptional regulator|uniref:HTH-type transcriptional regulator BetI n=1 Tax=Methylobacterium isbiliense TaxID=315478 RepID=A0ABQ4SG18_9HYPH|nr:TetR/AcrR family transcriptional regulator [Methylobacterium isbiliense]MDN3621663.1 TetR/AcrR family transcriptional regulator [Methylobacterium isbiliense]GJE00693.1 HTH-type transcriptional regulator BetI [Methylobacterium isbiliense]
MARTRASDYDDKRRTILDRSAELFAAHGFDRASMSRIADACGVSKANLYHYYRDKEAILFDVIRVHLEVLLEAVEAADLPGLPPQERLRRLVGALLEAYRDADAQHKVQINDLALLPPARQDEVRAIERELVRLFAEAIAGVAPHLRGTRVLKPVTMSFFGMVNWHYLWFREGGGFTRSDYADLVTRIIADGTRGIAAEPEPARAVAAGR